MKKLFIIILCFFTTPVFGALIDTNATTETQALYTQLQDAQGNYMYFGQHKFIEYTADAGEVCDAYQITGKYPYVMGHDYREYYFDGDTKGTRVEYLKHIRTHYRNGGIIQLSWHMINPVTYNAGTYNPTGTGSAWDDAADTVSKILPGGADRATYLGYLDSFAAWCNSLTDDRGNLIPLVFRPFHECDGGGFWWGDNTPSSCSDAEYITLYQDLVTYVRDTKGVHNIIWAYTPNHWATFTDRYPGDNYVDVIGVDIYWNTGAVPWALATSTSETLTELHKCYDEANNRSKVFIIAEGCKKLLSNTDADYWTTNYVDPILADNKAKNAAYTFVWTSPSYGADADRVDAPSFLEMSQNPKIKMLQYYNNHIYNATIRNATFN